MKKVLLLSSIQFLLIVAISAMYLKIHITERSNGYDSMGNMVAVGPIEKGVKIQQEFLSSLDSIDSINLLVATYARVNHSHVQFTVERQMKSGWQQVSSQTISVANWKDNDFYRFSIPVQKEVRNIKFRITLSSPDATSSNAVTAWRTQADIQGNHSPNLEVNGTRYKGYIPFYIEFSDVKNLKGDFGIILNTIKGVAPPLLVKISTIAIPLFLYLCLLCLNIMMQYLSMDKVWQLNNKKDRSHFSL